MYNHAVSAQAEIIYFTTFMQKIATIVTAPQRHGSLPDELRMKPVICDIVTVTETMTQLRTAAAHTFVVIGASRHVDAPHTAGRPDFICLKACRNSEKFRCLRGENPGTFYIVPGCASAAGRSFSADMPVLPHSRGRFAALLPFGMTVCNVSYAAMPGMI